MADAKRLAKNTMFMYFRMFLIMLVSIYTSRVILDKLGVDDYGIYNAVASVVAMTTFLTSTLTTSSSRFVNYALGQKESEKLKITFSTVFYTHLVFAVIIVIILETLGFWYLETKFIIPSGRESAVYAIFHISIITVAMTILQVPYTAVITAHEQMGVYAYVGIFDAIGRLAVVYLLIISPIDKLIFYAFLIMGVQMSTNTLYILYCINKDKETREYRIFDFSIFKGVMGFSGWTLIANLSSTLLVQGPTVLLNLFFAPAIIASRALASQISQAIMLFVSNFRIALNPQIIKSYAAGEYESSKLLSLQSTLIVFDLVLFLGLPCILTMKSIMSLWLVEVPPLAIEFAQIGILSQIIGSIASSLYIPFVASGKLKLLSLVYLPLDLMFFVILYLIFKMGGSPLWSQWLYLVIAFVSVIFVRPILLKHELKYSISEILPIYGSCLEVLVSSSILSISLYFIMPDKLIYQVILFVSTAIIVLLCSYAFMDKTMKQFIISIVRSRLSK